MSLQDEMDKAGFELLSQNQPKLIKEIEAALAQGATARQIEQRLLSRFGESNLTAALAVGAAYHIEKNAVIAPAQ